MNFWRFHTLFFLLLVVPATWYSQASQGPVAIPRQALELQQAGDYAAAVNAYRNFLKTHPDDADALSNLGVVLVHLGRYSEAIEEYKAAERLRPGDWRIKLNLALAYRKSGRLHEATAQLEELHSLAPQ